MPRAPTQQKQTTKSPLYTSKRRELEKLEILAVKGRDLDGAMRAKNRKDAQTNG